MRYGFFVDQSSSFMVREGDLLRLSFSSVIHAALPVQVAPAEDAMRKIAASSTHISTRYGAARNTTEAVSSSDITAYLRVRRRSSSWISEVPGNLIRAWTNAALSR
jgi:hypothetical protein